MIYQLLNMNMQVDPGAGPFLAYTISSDFVNLTCSTTQVFPEPDLSLAVDSEPQLKMTTGVTTTIIRRGIR